MALVVGGRVRCRMRVGASLPPAARRLNVGGHRLAAGGNEARIVGGTLTQLLQQNAVLGAVTVLASWVAKSCALANVGESQVGTFFRVIVPLVTPGIISSLLIAFTISLDEFIIAFFLTGTDVTLPVYIWGQLRFPARLPSVMALGFLMVILSLMLLLTAEYFRRRANRLSGAADTDMGLF